MNDKMWIPILTSLLAMIGTVFNFYISFRLARQKNEHEKQLVDLTARTGVNSIEQSAALADTRDTLKEHVAQAAEAVAVLQALKDVLKEVPVDHAGWSAIEKAGAFNRFDLIQKHLSEIHGKLYAWLPQDDFDVVHSAYGWTLPLRSSLQSALLETAAHADSGFVDRIHEALDRCRAAQRVLRKLVVIMQERLDRGLEH